MGAERSRDVQLPRTRASLVHLLRPARAAAIGSANRDPRQFPDAGRFNIGRDPNPHVAFGHGIHFCLGAALSRMESKIALSDLLERFKTFELATDQPWKPRGALHVHGPDSLPIRFEAIDAQPPGN